MTENSFFAHTHSSGTASWQHLSVHLRNVANEAYKRAKASGIGDDFEYAASFAGWLHDVGKYRKEFQEMLHARRQKGELTRHKQAGAAWAADGQRMDLSFAIAGHHGGLPDYSDLKSLICGPGGRDVAHQVRETAVGDCPELANPLSKWKSDRNNHFDLWTRLLFSCLVDADWTDTGNHERTASGLAPLTQSVGLTVEDSTVLLDRVLNYIGERSSQCRQDNLDISADHQVPAIRAEILQASLQTAENATGMFSMTVPTGGGKTLSALAFALAHAKTHGLRRVIYVAPYLSILEQNAREIRRALGVDGETPDADLVFEHYSLAEPAGGRDVDEAESEVRSRQAQNWSSPFIVTTNVQFFESLFSNQPGQCRKLHNIARSVVILDECQTLPPGLIEPTCAMLNGLSSFAGASIVLCTATQPAWLKRETWDKGLTNVREIVPAELRLFERLKRVNVEWPSDAITSLEWSSVAEIMIKQRASLCIVNTKKAARDLLDQLTKRESQAPFHLSTSMCPAHRLEVLDEVRRPKGR